MDLDGNVAAAAKSYVLAADALCTMCRHVVRADDVISMCRLSGDSGCLCSVIPSVLSPAAVCVAGQ